MGFRSSKHESRDHDDDDDDDDDEYGLKSGNIKHAVLLRM